MPYSHLSHFVVKRLMVVAASSLFSLTLALGLLMGVKATNPTPHVLAATLITVNTTTDELNTDGDCSLREAIQAANTDTAVDACPAGSGADTISLSSGVYTLTIPGAGENANNTGDLDITDTLIINGAGATTTVINANGLDRALDTLNGAALTLNDLTIQNGNAIGNGGGIFTRGNAVLNNVNVFSNTSTGQGGGLNSEFVAITVTGGVFRNNRCTGGGCLGGGAYLDSGGTVTGTQFISNTAVTGGGLGTAGGPVVNVLLAGNSSTGAGNGAALYANSFTVDLVHTTIVSPMQADKAAIWAAAGTVNITNTIIVSHSVGVVRTGAATVREDYNLFFGNTTNLSGTLITSGGHSITGTPAFIDVAADNYHLGAGSAALDGGTNAGVITDFEGDPRPIGNGFDIGYDEKLSDAAIYLPIIIK